MQGSKETIWSPIKVKMHRRKTNQPPQQRNKLRLVFHSTLFANNI